MGVIGGIGCGLGYISPVSTLVKWVKGASRWLANWKRRGRTRTARGRVQDVLNRDSWERLDRAARALTALCVTVTWQWQRGLHAGHVYNDHCVSLGGAGRTRATRGRPLGTGRHIRDSPRGPKRRVSRSSRRELTFAVPEY